MPQTVTGYDPNTCKYERLCGENCIATCIKDPKILEVYTLIIDSFQCKDYADGNSATKVVKEKEEAKIKFLKAKGKLTLADLKNAEYCCFWYSEVGKIRLKNGAYFKKYPDSTILGVTVGVDEDNVAFGDLNNDEKEDAVVVLYSNGGGSGCFRELAVMINQNGIPKYLVGKNLGDRVIVNSVLINKAGEIIVDMMTHGPNDGMCCPTVRKITEYKLYGHTLIELRERGKASNIDLNKKDEIASLRKLSEFAMTKRTFFDER